MCTNINVREITGNYGKLRENTGNYGTKREITGQEGEIQLIIGKFGVNSLIILRNDISEKMSVASYSIHLKLSMAIYKRIESKLLKSNRALQ